MRNEVEWLLCAAMGEVIRRQVEAIKWHEA